MTNTNFYSSLHIICENSDLFTHWLTLERQVCQKKLDHMFSCFDKTPSQSQDDLSNKSNQSSKLTGLTLLSNEKLIDEIWSCNYSDVDTMKPPHCAESFILMLKSIAGK